MEVRCLLSNISFVSAFGNQILYTSPNQISLYIFLNILFFLFPKFPLFAIQRVLQIYFITCTSLLQLLIYLYIICSIQTNNISLQPANNPIKHMNQSSYLLQILKSCLNSNTVQQSQKQLVEYSHNSSFVSQLLQLLPDQEFNLTMMVLSTLKNFIQEKYNNPHDTMPQEQKQLLRNNLFNLYYVIANTPQAVNLYKQIVYMIVAVDYEKYTPLFYEHMKKDLDSGAISASVYFSRQVARFYEWLSVAQRKPLQQFINYLFPKLEELVEKILTDYNNLTRKLLQQLLQMFYSAFHIQVPEYLRNFDNLDRWLLYLRTTLKAPLDDFEQNHIQVSRIYVKLFSMYCRDGTDGKLYKGWGAQFRQKHGVDLYTQVVQILINPLPSQQVMANILTCITTVTNNPDLKPLFQQQHCQAIIYKHLLPFMQSTNEDYSYFKNDGLEYIRRIEDLTCHPYRRCSLDLIKSIMEKFNYGTKSQLIKFVQHSADVLGHSNYTDKQKQVIILVLIEIAPLVMKNNFLKENFETFIQQYFIPILKSQNSILISQTLSLLSKFLRLTNLSNQTVSELMSICYDKMCEQNIVVKYYAILAFTQLLDYKQALDTARPHFQNILQIYVKMLDVMDHEGLISSLKSIVQCFSGEIVGVAQNLANHLFSMFYELHNKESEENGGGEEEQNESRQATAALSTIKSILQSPLSEQSYYQISEKVMILLQSLCSQYDDYFQQILNLLNTLVYKANQIVNFQFPYLLCRKLLEGDNSILVNCSNKQFQSIISEAEIADTQYSQSLISIIKNLIKKMPQQILHHYPYPTNPQLMLCMIQNKKLDQNNLTSLNTSQIDNQWSLILQSYTAIIYGFGEVCNTSDLKMLSGVSLYPWIQYKLDSEVIKKLLITLQDQQGEDDYYEENTVQMLQKYANQDEEQDAADYYISSGGNYSYMYDSPYDYEKDKYLLVNKMKKLSSTQFNFMLGQLSIQNRNRLESLFSQCQNLPTSQ